MKIMAVAANRFKHLPTDVLVTDIALRNEVFKTIMEEHVWKDRADLENDPTFRQPIPYCLVSYGANEYVLMQRMKGQGEARLLGKHYIGAGGHVEEGHNLFYTALKEVTEELGLPVASLVPEGFMISTGGPVEDVHIGLFFSAVTHYKQFSSPEENLHNARWVGRSDLLNAFPDMEKWSQIVVGGWIK